VERVEYGQGCRDLIARATRDNPAFICEILTPPDAIEVVKKYPIDAAISLTEGPPCSHFLQVLMSSVELSVALETR
jgi:hypothetical protein